MELNPVAQRFILHWGEMGSRWGVNRTVAQIHALLFLSARPMDAEEISETLNVARSNVSTSLKELQAWKLARISHVMGDRRDYFETGADVWELFRLIVEGRKQREIDPTITVLRECMLHADMKTEPAGVQQRVRETLAFLETLTAWSDEMLKLTPEQLMKTLGIGAKLSKAVRGNKK